MNNDQANTAESVDIDLALSGGGFRAALFHLGVTGFLQSRGLLPRVKTICSVSGGSVLAAYLVTHWNEIVNGDNAFRQRSCDFVEWIMTRDVSGRVLKASKGRILRFRPLDSEVLANEYSKILAKSDGRGVRWDDLDDQVPKLHILATHLNTGHAAAYSATGFHVPKANAGERQEVQINSLAQLASGAKIRSQEIARAVAASSAFPPAFSPIALVPGNSTHLLTDGGVYDNSGVKYLTSLYDSNAWKGDDAGGRLVIVSDAGREFPAELGQAYETILALALRVTDTQGDRIAVADSNSAADFFEKISVPVLRVSIHDAVQSFPGFPKNHTEEVQQLLRMIRTELDRFSAEESLVLYRHGFLACQQQYAEHVSRRLSGHFVRKPLEWNPIDDKPVVSQTDDPAASPSSRSKDLKPSTRVRVDSLSKETLELQLKSGHVIRKLDEISKWVIASAIVFLVVLIGMSVIAYSVIVPHNVTPVEAIGELQVEEVSSYDHKSWAAKIPILTNIVTTGNAQYVYTATSSKIGSLTNHELHTSAVLDVNVGDVLANTEIYLFLEQFSDDGSQYIVIRESSVKKYVLPPGMASDRIRILIVSASEISDYNNAIKKEVRFKLERK